MQFHYFIPRGGITTPWCLCAGAMIMLTTLTIFGNGCVFIALRRVRTSPAHYPLISLAAADMLLGCFILPIAAAREMFVFHINWIICSSWKTLDILCCTASILSLCVLGWERWSGITAPLARDRRARLSRMLSGLVWPVSLAVALPTNLISSPRHLHTGEEEKACPEDTNVSYVFFSATFSFYLPAFIMIVMYARILSALSIPPQIRSHRGRFPQDTGQKSSSLTETGCENNNNIQVTPKASHLAIPGGLEQESGSVSPLSAKHSGAASVILSRQRRATQTIIRLMAMFLICWTPFFIMLPIDSLCDCVHDSVWEWCTWLGYCNSALNPLIYAAVSPSVRRALHASLTSSSRREDMPFSPRR